MKLPDDSPQEPTPDAELIAFTPEKVRANWSEKQPDAMPTDEQFELLNWMLALAAKEKLNLSGLARVSKVDASILHKLFSGTYAAKLARLQERLIRFRDLWDQRRAMVVADFAETILVKQIWKACDIALLYQTIFPIYGDSQTGKTTALERYAHDHKTHVVYVRMPSGGGLGAFLTALNRALGESTKASHRQMRERPFEVLTDSHLLIIDEIHQTVIVTGVQSVRINTVEYIREVWDRTRCGLVICGTNVFRDETEGGRHKKLLEQIGRRGFKPLQLPPTLSVKDLDKIAAAYGLSSAEGHTVANALRTTLVKTTGLRIYTNLLKLAAKLASGRDELISWQHFVAAHDTLAKMKVKEDEE